MTGLALYLSTCFGLPHYMMLLSLIPAVYFRKEEIAHYIIQIKSGQIIFSRAIWIITGIALFTFLNALFHGHFSSLSYPILLLLTAFIAGAFRPEDLRIISWMAAIEAIVCIVEISLKIPSIFPWIETKTAAIDSGLLYQNRVYGLSDESSNAAQKMMFGLFALSIAPFQIKKIASLIPGVLILMGILITFNRTVILVSVLYLVLNFISLATVRPINREQVKMLLYIIIGAFGLVLALVLKGGSEVMAQFTRGTGILDMAGRSDIWTYCLDFIVSHPILGNGSEKWYFGAYHAHNSYLQIAASHGIIVLFGFIVVVFWGINRNNIIRVICILLYSVFQYGFGWGISLLDIFFLAMLTKKDLFRNLRTGIEPSFVKN